MDDDYYYHVIDNVKEEEVDLDEANVAKMSDEGQKVYRTSGPGLTGMKQISNLPRGVEKVRGRKDLYMDDDYYYHVIDNVKEEEVDLDEVTVGNSAKAFDIKKQAVALKAQIAKLKNTPGDVAHMKMLDAKRSFDKKIAALQALDVDAYEIKKLKEEALDEADDAVAKQIKARKEQIKKQIQQKIAQKQMSVMQQKAQKKIQDIKASNDKDVYVNMKKKGKDEIEVSPELREAEDFPGDRNSHGED
jgi:hypothetical protein